MKVAYNLVALFQLRFPDSFLLTSLAILLTGVGVTVISYDSENRAFVNGCNRRWLLLMGHSLHRSESVSDHDSYRSHCEQYKYRHECFHSKPLTLKSNSNNSNGTYNKSKCNRKNPFGWCVYLVTQVK